MSENSGKEDNKHFYRSIEVDPGQSPRRIDKFLMDRVENISRTKLQKAMDKGRVLVDGERVKPNYKVKPGERIDLYKPDQPERPDHLVKEDIPLNIEYEDEHLLIVHKPAGMVVHPGVGHHSGTLVNGLAYYLNKDELPVLDGNPGNRPGLVHRIDKDTSGLLVVAKTDKSMRDLAAQFKAHTIEREYWALVWGEPEPEKGTIEGAIGRHPKRRKKMHVFDDEQDKGKDSVTHYETIQPMYYVSLVKCHLETGRTHQIRVHFQHINHPVFNDQRYGGDRIRKGTVFSKYKQFVENSFDMMPRHALHAKTLGFIHPATGEKVRFESELPEDFQAVLDRWERYVNTRKSKLQ